MACGRATRRRCILNRERSCLDSLLRRKVAYAVFENGRKTSQGILGTVGGRNPDIWLACRVMLPGSVNLGFIPLEYRLGTRSILGAIVENVAWIHLRERLSYHHHDHDTASSLVCSQSTSHIPSSNLLHDQEGS